MVSHKTRKEIGRLLDEDKNIDGQISSERLIKR